jgi:hypothetical protein
MANRQGRKGPRPNTWKVQGQIPHQQHIAWQKMKAQAKFREEEFLLTFEDFQWLWQTSWDVRGRASEQYCLTREDPEGAWVLGNVVCVTRKEYLTRAKLYKSRRNGI